MRYLFCFAAVSLSCNIRYVTLCIKPIWLSNHAGEVAVDNFMLYKPFMLTQSTIRHIGLKVTREIRIL